MSYDLKILERLLELMNDHELDEQRQFLKQTVFVNWRSFRPKNVMPVIGPKQYIQRKLKALDWMNLQLVNALLA